MRAFIPPPFFVGEATSLYDPIYGKRLKANLRISRISSEYRSTITINNLGYRGPEPAHPPVRPVVFLGDSFTFGAEVNDDKLFSHLVGLSLGRDVVNAGISGIGNGYWVLFLERKAPALDPSAVVLQHCINDYSDNLQEGLYSLDADGELVAHPPPSPGIKRHAQTIMEAIPGLANSHLVGLLRGLEARMRSVMQQQDYHLAPARASDALTLALTRRALALCRERGWPVVGLTTHIVGPRLEALVAVYAEFGAPVVIMQGPDEHPGCYFARDMHWTEQGHAVVAQRLVTILQPLLP
ncbi:SGNH/GDSL hydrolase family protein [Megalodesulfovibrio paquesii]